MQASRREIIDTLRDVFDGQRPSHFQFDQNGIADKQVRDVLTDDNPVVANRHAVLLKNRDAVLPQFVSQSIFINLLAKPLRQACS